MGDRGADVDTSSVLFDELYLFDLQRFEPQALGRWFNPHGFRDWCFVDDRLAAGRFVTQGHRDIDVLKDAARGDAENTVGGFDEVVALASAMLAAEVVDEAEAGAELFGFD